MVAANEKVQQSPTPEPAAEFPILEEVGSKEDELLALVGHELRGPLAAIRNAVAVLSRKGDDAATREWVQGVLDRQTRQMSSLIEEMLDLSRFSRGKGRLEQRLVDLRHVVPLAIETVRPCIDERGHVLVVVLPPGPVTVKADPIRLAQVVSNLLGNAAKYTDRGGRIELTVLPEGDEVVIRVRDNGIGIAPEVLPHVFDLFCQSPRAAGRAAGGLGIGLALVRQLVEMHGGSVSASSAGPGQGSEFVVRLPRTPGAQTR
jgi:signal transduction histidine kinase